MASSPGFSIPPPWTPQLDKLFEKALAIYDSDSADRWENVSAMLPGVDSSEVKKRFESLLEDLNSIETGRVAVPSYQKAGSSSVWSSDDDLSPTAKKGAGHTGYGYGSGPVAGGSNGGGSSGGGTPGKGTSSKCTDAERRKGIPWSEEEHRLFLLGLAKFGKGDWRSISRNFVISRTPTQVASHAQKYFIRLNSINNKDKRRSSIHDITSVADGDSLPQSPGVPITGLPSPLGNNQWPRGGMHPGTMYDMSTMGVPHNEHHPVPNAMLMATSGHPHHVPYGQVSVMQVPQLSIPQLRYGHGIPQSANA